MIGLVSPDRAESADAEQNRSDNPAGFFFFAELRHAKSILAPACHG
jgi:hypothetical protein